MGYLHKGVCHPTIEGARADYCSGAVTQFNTSAVLVTSQCIATDFTLPTMLTQVQMNSVPRTPFSITYPAFPDCLTDSKNIGNPFVLSVADGVAMSFLILGVWLSAAIFRWLTGVLSSNRDAD